MELNEAINIINNFRTWYMGGDISNDVLQEIYKSIDTVLEELNNRIPRKDIEDKIEETQQEIEVIKKQKDNIKNGMKILFREGYIENLEEILNKE